MHIIARSALAAILVFGAGSAQAQQQTVNIRGMIDAFDGTTLTITAREGRVVKVTVPESVNVNATKAITLADIAPGTKLGVTTVQRGDQVIAIDVRPIPPQANSGQSSYDLQPNATMNNGVLEGTMQAVAGGGSEMMLNYGSGTAKVLVPPGTPMSQSIPGARSDLKVGETVFVSARRDGEDALIAVRVQVSKDDARPTQ